jgi:hypothetical protein
MAACETGDGASVRLRTAALLRQMTSSVLREQRSAVARLRRIVKEGSWRDEAFAELVTSTSSVSAGVVSSAVTMLRFFSRVELYRGQLVDAGAIPVLVKLMQSSDPRVKDCAVDAIGILSDNEARLTLLADAGAIPVLLRSLVCRWRTRSFRDEGVRLILRRLGETPETAARVVDSERNLERLFFGEASDRMLSTLLPSFQTLASEIATYPSFSVWQQQAMRRELRYQLLRWRRAVVVAQYSS